MSTLLETSLSKENKELRLNIKKLEKQIEDEMLGYPTSSITVKTNLGNVQIWNETGNLKVEDVIESFIIKLQSI